MNDVQRPADDSAADFVLFGDSPPGGLRGIARLPMHVEVRNQVRDLIVKGHLRPGEHINENDLAAFLRVSRTPLREALKELTGEGLVLHEPNKGFNITRITVEHTAELFESLAGIERFCGEIATAKITDAQLRRFTGLHQEMIGFRDEGDRSRYFELNESIHRAYVLMSANTMLRDIHARLMVGARRIRFTAIRYTDRWDESVSEHKAILEAMEARQAEEAGRLIERHVRGTGEFVCAHIKDLEPARPRRRRTRAYDRRSGF